MNQDYGHNYSDFKRICYAVIDGLISATEAKRKMSLFFIELNDEETLQFAENAMRSEND